ncbi:MAG: hypothetical protein CW346_00005, partial [Bacillaceae bacterium]|nr:hypothetical protein [Bacillaceae bacterium]
IGPSKAFLFQSGFLPGGRSFHGASSGTEPACRKERSRAGIEAGVSDARLKPGRHAREKAGIFSSLLGKKSPVHAASVPF